MLMSKGGGGERWVIVDALIPGLISSYHKDIGRALLDQTQSLPNLASCFTWEAPWRVNLFLEASF